MRARRDRGFQVVVAFAISGIVGPILFWILVLVAQWLHPGYDAWKTSVSRLILGPFGWLQTVNFYVLALFTAAFGAAVWLGIAKSHLGRFASLLMVVMGIAQLLTAVFRVDVNPYGTKSMAYSIHNAVFIVGAGTFPFAALFLLPDLWSAQRWRPFVYVTLAAAVMALALELVWLASRSSSPHLIDPWFGIYERTLLSIPLAWMMVVSARLLYLSRRHDARSEG